jgi:uncharacterized membrane protein
MSITGVADLVSVCCLPFNLLKMIFVIVIVIVDILR